MDTNFLNNEFYSCIAEALKKFSTDAENHNVYAIAFDCDSSVGTVVLRYRNRSSFELEVSRYEEYQKKYGWAVYGLYGSEYDVGEFDIIEYQKTETVKHFTDSYYYHEVGSYYGVGEPIEDIKDNYHEIFWDMVLFAINRLKADIGKFGISTTDNFIIFHCDHDESQEDREKKISMTVDSETMKKLC